MSPQQHLHSSILDAVGRLARRNGMARRDLIHRCVKRNHPRGNHGAYQRSSQRDEILRETWWTMIRFHKRLRALFMHQALDQPKMWRSDRTDENIGRKHC